MRAFDTPRKVSFCFGVSSGAVVLQVSSNTTQVPEATVLALSLVRPEPSWVVMQETWPVIL